MNMNSVWAAEKAAPVFRSGFGIIPPNLFYCSTTRKNRILRTDLFTVTATTLNDYASWTHLRFDPFSA